MSVQTETEAIVDTEWVAERPERLAGDTPALRLVEVNLERKRDFAGGDD